MYSLELYVLWKLFTAISVIKTLYDIGVLHVTCWILVNLPLFSAFTVAAVVSYSAIRQLLEESRKEKAAEAKLKASKDKNKADLSKMVSVAQAVKKAQDRKVNNDNKPVFVRGVNITLLKSLSQAERPKAKEITEPTTTADRKPIFENGVCATPLALLPPVTQYPKAMESNNLQKTMLPAAAAATVSKLGKLPNQSSDAKTTHLTFWKYVEGEITIKEFERESGVAKRFIIRMSDNVNTLTVEEKQMLPKNVQDVVSSTKIVAVRA